MRETAAAADSEMFEVYVWGTQVSHWSNKLDESPTLSEMRNTCVSIYLLWLLGCRIKHVFNYNMLCNNNVHVYSFHDKNSRDLTIIY